MIDEKIKCCDLLESFIRRYRKNLSMEIVPLGDGYVFALRGLIHIDQNPSVIGSSSCEGGCISCGPPTPSKPKETWRAEPFETVWRVCPFCGGNFVRR